MKKLLYKPITEENLSIMEKFCNEAFDTHREQLSDTLFGHGEMSDGFEEVLGMPAVDAWAFYDGEQPVAGALVSKHLNHHNELELFFCDARQIGHGYGTRAWFTLEKIYPDTKVWKTITPLHLPENLIFYVNHCGFHITKIVTDEDSSEPFCIFEKKMK